jgi:predicted O-methyltransferase YrrM
MGNRRERSKSVTQGYPMKRKLRGLARDATGAVHRLALKAGIVILPNHYYTPIADVHELRRTREFWAPRSSMAGIEMNVAEQTKALRDTVMPYEPEFRGNRIYNEGSAKGFGPGFGYIEAQCFHGVLRYLKPRRIIEVGSGVSTYCALQAMALNASDGVSATITCIEPYPSHFLREARGKQITLIQSCVQHLDPTIFRDLQAGDLLFIDSTHAVKPGGDVTYIYLEVLPRLNPGVIVHIHDIYLPYLYQRDLLRGVFQWSETALLQALLTFNSKMSTWFCLSLLHYDAPDELREIFPEYRPQPSRDGLCEAGAEGHFPCSIYLKIL